MVTSTSSVPASHYSEDCDMLVNLPVDDAQVVNHASCSITCQRPSTSSMLSGAISAPS